MSNDEFSVAVLVALAVVTVLMIVVALPVVLSMRHAAKDREFQHAERLKALEMGRPFPGDPAPDSSLKGAGAKIGVLVPICVFGIALAATTSSNSSEAADVAIWVSAGCVGVTGLICGTVLTFREAMQTGRGDRCFSPSKHSFEESEIDTVSRRGI